MTKAYSYIRFSSEQQRKGHSLERQLKSSEKYCEENNLELVKNYTDLGISGFKGKNKGHELGRLTDAIRNGKIESGSYLLIESLDRMSRDSVPDALSDFLAILKRGIIIITFIDGMKYTKENINNIGSLLTSIVVMLRANDESETKSNRALAKWQKRRSEAHNKIITSICPAWMKAKDDRTGFDLIPEKSAIIKKIFELILDGNGCVSVCRYLNETKIPCVSENNHWTIVYIKRIVHNQATFGRYVFNKTKEIVEDYYPPAISKELYEQAQTIMVSRKNHSGRKGGVLSNLFVHLAVCGYCGAPLQYKSHGSEGSKLKEMAYLICNNSFQKCSNCNCLGVLYNKFEELVFKFIKEIDIKSIISSDNNNIIKHIQDEIKGYEIMNIKEQQEIESYNNDTMKDGYNRTFILKLNEKYNKFDENIKDRSNKIKELKLELIKYDSLNAETLKMDIELLNEHLKGLPDIERYRKRVEINQRMKNIIENIEVFTYKSTPSIKKGRKSETQKKLEKTFWLKINFRNKIHKAICSGAHSIHPSDGNYHALKTEDIMELSIQDDNEFKQVMDFFFKY